ncbi:MAG: phosphoenolpyruvate--protein phosphotransferase [Frankiaceae bacterium]
MTTPLTGIGVSPGTATGPVARMAPPPELPPQTAVVEDTAHELETATAALEAVGSDLDARAAAAGGEAADVLFAQAMMARDPGLAEKITVRVGKGETAPHAVSGAFEEYRTMLANAGAYMAERVADLDDIRTRAVATLLGVPMPGVPSPGHPFVLVAPDLAPADTATIDATQVLAIVTEHGGPTSHTAILAKSLGLPAVVACADAGTLADGDRVLVDGASGTVEIDPLDEVVAEAARRDEERRAALAASTGPGRTADGRGVQLLLNIGGEGDLDRAVAADAEGVGLFRTEFLFLDRTTAPTVVEQEAVYARVFAAFRARKVVVRTLDAGADKPLGFVTQPDEPNPALGIRGLRTSRRFPQLLEQQLTAIAQAAAASETDVWVMAPMVSTPGEAAAFAQMARTAGLRTAGVMVEVPAAALRARAVIAGCDFLSLGTNDLAQYTFAADRMEGELANLLDPWQPALLDLVGMTAEAGASAGKPVGVCGEAASDALLALVLVGLGVTSLSMAPVSVPDVRASLARHTYDECRQLAALASGAADGTSARQAVQEAVRGAGG